MHNSGVVGSLSLLPLVAGKVVGKTRHEEAYIMI